MQPPDYNDCEVVTNCVFDASRDDAKVFSVKLKFGNRKISSDMLVLTYVDANEEVATPSNYGTLSFVRGDGGRMYSIYKRADGVFVGSGFTLFIK